MCLPMAVDSPEIVLSKGEHAGHEWITVHNGVGYRCGYVKVEKGHPWHRVEYGDIKPYIEVHGGLTFSREDKPCDQEVDDTGWWLGFDCAHSGDIPDPTLPISEATKRHNSMFGELRDGTIKSQEYVESECRDLCEQARDAQ